MAQSKPNRKKSRLPRQAVRRVGTCLLSSGQAIRVDFPKHMSKQATYDAASQLAKMCKMLIDAADAMPDEGETPLNGEVGL
jgi:hypothetical protein